MIRFEYIVKKNLLLLVENEAQTYNKIKTFKEISFMMHEANRIDEEYLLEKYPNLNVGYQIAMPFCIEKIEVGFLCGIYGLQEFPQAFLWLKQFYGQLLNNLMSRLTILTLRVVNEARSSKPDPKVISSLGIQIPGDDQLLSYQIFEYKAKETYAQIMRKLSNFMLNKGLLPTYGDEIIKKRRYIKKFKIFEECIFTSKISYDEFKGSVEQDLGGKDDEQILQEILDEFKDYQQKLKLQSLLHNIFKIDKEGSGLAETKKVIFWVIRML